MSVDTAELEKWFTDRPQWLQDAARRLFQTGDLTADDLTQALVLCKREAKITVDGYDDLTPLPIPAASFNVAGASIALRLDAVSEVKGINALAPRKALQFGVEPIVIVYGANGSGKSGYIRVLKHSCGGRGLNTLHGNVFEASQQPKSCKISYELGTTKKDIVWTPATGIHSDLRNVALYDTDCAHVYVNNENEVTYEPPLLSYFRRLVEACETLDAKLAAEITAQVTAKPSLPPEYNLTASGAWFNRINWQTTAEDVTAHCMWDEAHESELTTLNQRLTEANPAEKAKALRKTKGHLADFVSGLRELENAYSDAAFATLSAARVAAN